MSILIDNLVHYVQITKCEQSINNKYYIAKWYGGSGYRSVRQRLKDAFRVLIGSSRAYHFKEDEL